MARSYYQEEKVLLKVPQPRGEEIRVMEATRADGTKYVDIRVWYEDDLGNMQPGKGIGKPDVNGTWDQIAQAIMDREQITATMVYNPKTQKLEPEEKTE